ncbi:DNA repair protein RadC [Porphyromonadaceae bacterium W3.11]|nr:DNA repair protein RadC [Porphyromonadaceae bacterium W3.11]
MQVNKKQRGTEAKDHVRIKEMAETERPREKAIKKGIRSLTEAELLAVQIGSGVRGVNVLELSYQLLREADNNLYKLYQMLSNGYDLGIKGLGAVKKIQVLSALELGVRMESDRQAMDGEKESLSNSRCIYNFISRDLYGLTQEELWIILLDNQHNVKDKVKISEGGLSSSTADIRVILRKALQSSSTALALVHNHPSGSLYPSSSDDDITFRLYKACNIMQIRMVDHIIYTESGYYSYFDEGRFDNL